MIEQTKQLRHATKALRELQSEHDRRIQQTARLRRKLDKVTGRVAVLETKLARAEVEVHEVLSLKGGLTRQAAKRLRPARLIINPNGSSFSKQCQSPENLVEMLARHGIAAQVYLKTSGRDVRRWVREASRNGEALVIVCGGDGTLEDAALALVGSQTAMGIIPAGYMNNLARCLGIPLDAEQACALVGAGMTRPIDAGAVRVAGAKKRTLFLETAGLGLSVAWPAGQAIEKHRWGKLPDTLRKIFNLGGASTKIELEDGTKLETQAKLVTVSNAPYFGMNNLVAPEAKLDDGALDLALYDGLGDIDLAQYFANTTNGKRDDKARVTFYRARRLHMQASEAMPATADKSEVAVHQEFDFEVIPGAVRMVVGQGIGLSWPVTAVPQVQPASDEATAASSAAARAATEDVRPANGHLPGGPAGAEAPEHAPEPIGNGANLSGGTK